jgi:hypothetical protein
LAFRARRFRVEPASSSAAGRAAENLPGWDKFGWLIAISAARGAAPARATPLLSFVVVSVAESAGFLPGAIRAHGHADSAIGQAYKHRPPAGFAQPSPRRFGEIIYFAPFAKGHHAIGVERAGKLILAVF